MNGLRSLSWLDSDVRAQIGDDQAEAMRLIHELLERQTSGPSSPVARQAQVDPGSVTAFLPTSNRPNRAVYYPGRRRHGAFPLRPTRIGGSISRGRRSGSAGTGRLRPSVSAARSQS